MKKKYIFLFFLAILSQQFVFSNTKREEVLVHYPSSNISKEELKEKNFDTIYLIAASPTSESIGSLGAHAFIALSHGNDISSAIALNFYAYHESLTTYSKIIRGATIGLDGYIDIRPFSNIAERYTIGQNRTLFVYQTNIDKNYIPDIIDEYYEYKERDIKYQFFNYNCSSLVGEIFSNVLNGENKTYDFPLLIMPGRLVYLFEKNGLIVDQNTISPPLVKAIYDNTDLLPDSILERYTYFKVHQSETIEEDGFDPFNVSFDNFESDTVFSEKVANTYVGMDSLKLSFGVSLFDNEVYQQRQSTILLYEFKLLDISFSLDQTLDVDEFTIIESGRYPKVNLLEITPSSYFSIKLNPINYMPDLNVGYGYSIGTFHTLFTLMPTLETNFSTLELTLKAKSIISFYTSNLFINFNLDYPIYNATDETQESAELKLGYKFNETLSIEGSYDLINDDYNVYLKYSFYPLLF
ncbi:MAG: DUF4105 domain-containing protein [Sphaerochaetaceae bacterium]|nr:DUF4105 domain-containing protein [Sphaerochaetaceae bacterium]